MGLPAQASEALPAAGDGLLSTLGPIGLAAVLGVVPVAYLLWQWFLDKREQARTVEFPTDGVWTLDLLKHFDGKRNPLCLGVCGKVVDCSSSENITYGQGYGALWAGNDATYALATLSLKKEDANKMDFKLSDFTSQQHTALAGWYKHFTTKYPVVGKLREYEGWDFSSVQEAAKAQTPFGAKATPASAEGATTLRPGDEVKLKGMDQRADLEGAVGILEDFNAAENKFTISMKDTEEVVLASTQQFDKL